MINYNQQIHGSKDEYGFERDEHIQSIVRHVFSEESDPELDRILEESLDLEEDMRAAEAQRAAQEQAGEAGAVALPVGLQAGPYLDPEAGFFVPLNGRPILGRGPDLSHDQLSLERRYSFCPYCISLQLAKGWVPSDYQVHRTTTDDGRIICPSYRVFVANYRMSLQQAGGIPHPILGRQAVAGYAPRDEEGASTSSAEGALSFTSGSGQGPSQTPPLSTLDTLDMDSFGNQLEPSSSGCSSQYFGDGSDDYGSSSVTAAVELPNREIQQQNYTSAYEPVDRLQFYHVQVNDTQENTVTTEGLGEYPADLENITSLMQFNTGNNLYANFIFSDPLLWVCISISKQEFPDVSGIGAAPQSITEGSSSTKPTTQNYLYMPTIGNLPLLDVPLDLPDLPGVADDVRYHETDGGNDSIAPSATTSKQPSTGPVATEADNKALPAGLPAVDKPIETIVIDDDEDEIIVIDDDDTPDVVKMPPPMPPPMVEPPKPPKAKAYKKTIMDKLRDATPKVIVEKIEPPEFEELYHKPSGELLLEMRTNLMEAIRKAGGRDKLKPVGTETRMQKKRKQIAPPSVDLMADLHSKLQMRRKGISGTKSDRQEPKTSFDAESTFTKISAMIPPPAANKDTTSSGTESEEDWQ